MIPIRVLIPAIVIGLGAASAARADLPPGYYVDSTEAFEPRLTWYDHPGDAYAYSIRRWFADSTSQRRLGIAEALYPPRDLLIGMAVTRNGEMGPDAAGNVLSVGGDGDAREEVSLSQGIGIRRRLSGFR